MKRSRRTHKVENLALLDEDVQSLHHLLNAGVPVPGMHVEEVDIVGTKLLERRVEGYMHGLDVVAHVHDFLCDRLVLRLVVGGVLDRFKSCPFLSKEKEVPWWLGKAGREYCAILPILR